jgi:FMN phosphatase YigB (HAD superfamily)
MTQTFDIWDTTLTRAVGSPSGVFWLLGRQLRPPGAGWLEPREFVDRRLLAERAARATVSGGEPTLDEIYREFAKTVEWSDADVLKARDMEVKLEYDLSCGVPPTLDHILMAREKQNAIFFLSDMYLSARQLEDMLKKAGAWKAGDRCYVSCEARASKRTSRLFKSFLHQQSISAREVLHWGDDRQADVEAARSLGMQTRHTQVARLNRYELLLDGFAASTAVTASVLAGTARVSRLRGAEIDDYGRGLQKVACSVAAPVLASFAGWLLARAIQAGIKRLYFVSRDGYVLLQFARRLAAAFDNPPELRYLYGSRRAWHAPALSKLGAEECDWLLEHTENVSLKRIFARIGCGPGVARDFLESWGLPEREWSRALAAGELSSLRDRFCGNARLEERLRRELSGVREGAISYLRGEGLFDGTSWAMVDLGWHGRLQHSLGRLLGGESDFSAAGFYFGLLPRPAAGQPRDMKAFLFDYRRERTPELPLPEIIFIMESFCCAPHGTVEGYHLEEGRWRPVLRQGHAEHLAQWGLNRVHLAFETYLAALPAELIRGTDWDAMRAPVAELLRQFTLHPGILEARSWGRFPYENDQGGGDVAPLAAPDRFSPKALLTCLSSGGMERPVVEWRGGARRQTPRWISECYKFACAAGQAQRRLRGKGRGRGR